jgi:hypothetical protein
MSALDNAGGAITEDGRLTGNTATTIFTATGATWIRSITASDNAAGSPTVTIDKYDGTNARVIKLTAAVPLIFNEPFLLPLGWLIRMTSSNAGGLIDWSITYDGPSAGKQR